MLVQDLRSSVFIIYFLLAITGSAANSFSNADKPDMSSMPYAMHLARAEKKRQQQQSEGSFNAEESRMDSYASANDDPTRYSSAMMNSIWGMYNKYSVHNLKNNQSLSPDESGDYPQGEGYDLSALNQGSKPLTVDERRMSRSRRGSNPPPQKRDTSPPPPAGLGASGGGYFSSLVGSFTSQFH